MKKKILLPIIIAVVAVALVAIAAITIYTGKYGKNAPILEVKEDVTVMEYSTVHIDEFIVRTENVSSVRIVDMKVMQNVSTGASGISENGQYVWTGDWSESYIVTIEATGNNGWKIRRNVKLYSYQEPPVYVTEENLDDVSGETQDLDELLEEECLLSELEAIEGDYTYEETKDLEEYYCVEKTFGTVEMLYFKDVNSFLTAYGFADADPFYEFYADGELKMTLYYNADEQLGCGDYGDGWGVCFLGLNEMEWSNYFWGDYMEPVIVYSGERPEDYMGDYSYDEVKEYDDAGRLVEYRVTNIADLTAECVDIESLQDSTVLWNDAVIVNYSYRDDGTLAYRDYHHNTYLFGTTASTLETWFDEMGRPVYERAYITHGSLNWYYIYEDDDEIPEFVLETDAGGGGASFTRFY